MSVEFTDELESAIYRGEIRHRRFTPTQHEFNYSLFMMYLKLEELPCLFQRLWQLGDSRMHWARFKRTDYIGQESTTLTEAVLKKMNELNLDNCSQLKGDVYFMGNLRYMGLYFSPLNLYFLKQGDSHTHMLAEVSNTPWNQRHHYLVDLATSAPSNKEFHVSPFNPLSQQYHWRIVPPGGSDRFSLHIESHDVKAIGTKLFDATLSMRRRELNQKEFNSVLLKSPVQTASILTGIYWQALRLLLKRTPIYSHRNNVTESTTENKIAQKQIK